MNNSIIKLSLISACLLTSSSAYEMKPLGFKAVGMGGTGVASTRGSLSSYYNPALIRFSDSTSEVSINASARFRESNMMENMDTLSNIDFETTVNNIANGAANGNKSASAYGLNVYIPGVSNTTKDRNNIQTAQDTLKKIASKNAFQVSVIPSLSTQFSDTFAIAIYNNVDIGMNLNINPKYTDLIFKDGSLYYEYIANDPDNLGKDLYKLYSSESLGKTAYESSSLEYASNNDINNISLKGESLIEVPLSYAKAYDLDKGQISWGASLKYMNLTTFNKTIKLGQNSDKADDDLNNVKTKYKNNIGLDLGLAYRPSDSKLTVGLVGKNVNSPKFKVESSLSGQTADYKIDASYRAGISAPVWNDNIELALDVDLTKNKTLMENEDSQMIGLGIELHPVSWFALRMGAMQDMASDIYDDGTIFTAGVGFGLKWFQVDFSAMMSSEEGRYDNEDIPRYAALNFSIVSKWGDGYNK